MTFISGWNIFRPAARPFLSLTQCTITTLLPPRLRARHPFPSVCLSLPFLFPPPSFFVLLFFFPLFFFFLIFGNQPVRSARCVGSKIVEIDGAFRDDRGPTSVSARNPLKYTGPFLFTPCTRIETGDSLARVRRRGEQKKKKRKKDIVERKKPFTATMKY